MRVHYLQHVPFEDLGSISQWLEKTDCDVTVTKFFESTAIPDLDLFDLLIILGGPMSVNEEERHPWLRMEKILIKNAIEAGKGVLGICLGAQLIANCMGEPVYPNRRKEIGWFPIEGIFHEEETTYHFPRSLDVFHWHGETFDLPDKAMHLARSEGCENQAFQLGRSVIGLQFHLETTSETAEAILTNCREQLQPSLYVQPEQVIFDQGPDKYQHINDEMDRVLTFLKDAVINRPQC